MMLLIKIGNEIGVGLSVSCVAGMGNGKGTRPPSSQHNETTTRGLVDARSRVDMNNFVQEAAYINQALSLCLQRKDRTLLSYRRRGWVYKITVKYQL